MFDGSAALDMADYYQPLSTERRGDTLNARVPKRLKEQLVKLAQIWEAREQIRQKDKDVEVTYSDVAVRLLAVGLAGAWEELEVEVDKNGDINLEQFEAKLEELQQQAKSLAK